MSASFDSYKIFYYVGKYKNITHAATSLFLSQSTVSRSIQSLESELGCKLFDRTQHGVSFTMEGKTLYSHISKACDQILMGEKKVMKLQRLAQGGLRIGVSEFIFEKFVLPVLESYHRDFPSVQLDIISHGLKSYSSMLSALTAGDIDIACTVSTEDEHISIGSADVTPLSSYEDILLAGNRFSELKGKAHSLSELSSYPFASIVGDNLGASYLDKLFLAHGVSVTQDFMVDSISMLKSVVKRCQCLAVVPSFFMNEFAGLDSVFEVSLTEPLPVHNVSIVTAKTAPQSAAREAFIKQLKKYAKLSEGDTQLWDKGR